VSLANWLGLSALFASLYILWQLRQILLIAFAAIVCATALHQFARLLQRRLRLRRVWATLLAILLVALILLGFFLSIVPPSINQFQELISTKLPEIWEALLRQRDTLGDRLPPAVLAQIPSANEIQSQLQPLVRSLLGGSAMVVFGSLSVAANLLLLLVLTLMLLAQPEAYQKVFVSLFPNFYRRRVIQILHQCEVSLGKWMAGSLLGMVVIALLSTIGLIAVGIPLALAQGLLAGLLNFIPNLGPTCSVILPMAIALLDDPWKALAILLVYIGIQQFESNLLTPYIMAQQVSLLPALTLLFQLVFASLFGLLGLVLALPLTVVGKVWLNAILVEDVLDRWHHESESD
jgi:predicted PurR-regulated permease PerM